MRLAPGKICRFSQSSDQLGESPFWHADSSTLWWVDIAGRALRARSLAGEERSWAMGDEPGCIAPTLDQRVLVALRSRIELFDPRDGSRQVLCAAPYDTATTRCNDGRCDPRGRFWVGTVFEPKTAPAAALYCLRHSAAGSWALEHEQGDNLTANGLAFSPDGRLAYWSNTPEHVIYCFDFDLERGHLSQRREFRRFARKVEGQPYGGRPDGVAIDNQGAYWVAMYEGGRLLKLSPAGETLQAVEVPVRCPTMPCFGDDDHRTLYVTSARRGRGAEELARTPLAGAVFAIRLDVPGLPVESFRG